MGGPMAANLVKAGHKVTAFDLVAASRDQAKADGAAIGESSVGSVRAPTSSSTICRWQARAVGLERSDPGNEQGHADHRLLDHRR